MKFIIALIVLIFVANSYAGVIIIPRASQKKAPERTHVALYADGYVACKMEDSKCLLSVSCDNKFMGCPSIKVSFRDFLARYYPKAEYMGFEVFDDGKKARIFYSEKKK